MRPINGPRPRPTIMEGDNGLGGHKPGTTHENGGEQLVMGGDNGV